MSEIVKIVEVGPLSGLHHEQQKLTAEQKVQLIRYLKNAGLQTIEAGAFAPAHVMLNLADSSYVVEGLSLFSEGLTLPVLVPNLQGYENAMAAGAEAVTIHLSATETFAQKHLNCSIEESLGRFLPVVEKAVANHIPVRARIACVAGCPYEGTVLSSQVVNLAEKLHKMGVGEISLEDTIGVANPAQIKRLLFDVTSSVPLSKIALHMHDTYGQGMANIYGGLEFGVRTFDSSIAGIGGCGFAKGAAGNVATEDLVYLLDGLGYASGVDLESLVRVSHYVADLLEINPRSKTAHVL
ncbi:MAG: hydroxymethylglutaryl-CoA lyase [Magnetococcales bacterium]|mgnify:CR=1 FL=1|nr:hydroxymethylglutaryl-CoA lyase [Magnetococcales bacterium]|tara:strand:- start:26575 stop:27462 length:888 start_codon:yes stop_codon:yes gene_type:complete